jgi:glycosyltransferase involved in cell wall biosynthesis
MRLDEPLISVVMPVYNAEKYVTRAIRSIIGQTYTNWELLICDDGSKDRTLKKIELFTDRRIRLFKNAGNKGSLLTRNRLFREVRGELIALQDADDESMPDRLQRQWFEFSKCPDLALCGTWARYTSGQKTIKIKQTPVSWQEIKERIGDVNGFCSASIMFKTSLFEMIEPYREYFAFKGNYDYDFTSRIAERFPCSNIPECLYVVSVRSRSNSTVKDMGDFLRLESDKIVRTLIKERSVKGTDSLQNGDHAFLKSVEAELSKPYREDPWLIYDKVLNHNLALNFHASAAGILLRGVLKNPFALRPYRLMLYAFKNFFK